MKVLVIPEDPTHDQYVLKPIVERLFSELGKTARIDILRDPHLRGIDHALDGETVRSIVADNPMIDLFLLIVDRDCDRFRNSERAAEREAEHETLLAALAVEEVEVWMLALQDDLPVSFSEIRAEGVECDPKERFAEPLLRDRGWSTGPGRGRKRAMRQLGGRWKTLCARCPEIADLQRRVESALS